MIIASSGNLIKHTIFFSMGGAFRVVAKRVWAIASVLAFVFDIKIFVMPVEWKLVALIGEA